ncbi:MAG: hypothetical protein K0R10_148 [Alphaproteobacteria bacterium]|jgi:hypothetical protein|nr:hypothetical protein [Alphaproteobacteria bacterium]
MHDLINTLSILQSLRPQTVQGSALNSGNIDMQGAEALAVVVLVGDIADTLDSTHRIDLKIEHAEDDGTGAPAAYAACTDDDVLNFTGLSSGIFMAVDGSGDEQKRYAIGYRGGKRFVKVTATPVSLSTGGPIAMLAIKGNLSSLPVANS